MEPRACGGIGAMGVAEIGFAKTGDVTRLAHLYQRDPLRVLFPTPEADDIPVAVLLTTSGGLVAGDRLAISARLDDGAAAHVTAASAEKIYRSTGATTAITQQLTAGEGAWLEYLPPETILFDGARLRRETRIELAPGAGFLGGGILVFGRHARGERLTHGLVHERWEVWRDGALALLAATSDQAETMRVGVRVWNAPQLADALIETIRAWRAAGSPTDEDVQLQLVPRGGKVSAAAAIPMSAGTLELTWRKRR